MDSYQESYFGPGVGPLKINEDSIIVIANNETNQYGTTKLGKKNFYANLCQFIQLHTKDSFTESLRIPGGIVLVYILSFYW